MYLLPIIAILIAVLSLAVGLYERLWLNVWKPFQLSCEIRGVIWQPPTRPGTPFSIVVPLALTNQGAQRGLVRAAFVQLCHGRLQTQYRLEAMALLHPARVTQNLEEPADDALEGFGAHILLGKYESKDIGVLYGFPPENAARFKWFDDPGLTRFGPYELQFWWLVRDKWTAVGQTQANFQPEYMETLSQGKPVVNLSGELHDLAPGAPGSPHDKYKYDAGDVVELVSDGVPATVIARWRRMPNLKSNQRLVNHYEVSLDVGGEIRTMPERDLIKKTPTVKP